MKIAIIIPYFGTWPSWTPLFLDSCRRNPTVDFFIFTDVEPYGLDKGGFPNIRQQRISFIDYCDLVSQRLDVDFHPTRAYKLCDLKPYYGIVHADLLKDYDFWGFCDVDLVLGDLRSFYTEEVLKRYDVISNHSDRVSGHLALIRNSEAIANLLMEIPDYKQMLSSDRHYAIDEIAFTKKLYPTAAFLWKTHKRIFFKFPFKDEFKSYVRFCSLVNRLMLPRRLQFEERFTTPWFTKEEASNQEVVQRFLWEYKDGHVRNLQDGKELPYLHFLSLKRHWPLECFHVKDSFDHAIIGITGIHSNH